MTPREAKALFEEDLKGGKCNENCPECNARELAISALEKQIPKKPKVLKVHDISNYKYGECECGEHIMDDHRYCSNCGQKIDWGEDKQYLNGIYSRDVNINGSKND